MSLEPEAEQQQAPDVADCLELSIASRGCLVLHTTKAVEWGARIADR
jgi:hypothetical protein